MKTTFFHRMPALLMAAGLCCTTLQSVSYADGWLRPLQYPAGQNHRYWAIGLSVPVLEPGVKMRTMSDGSHIFSVKAENGTGRIYFWDRISGQYNCPVLASTDSGFRDYTTLNRDNMVFTKNVYGQLRQLWGNGSTAQQTALLTKIQGAIAKDSDRVFSTWMHGVGVKAHPNFPKVPSQGMHALRWPVSGRWPDGATA